MEARKWNGQRAEESGTLKGRVRMYGRACSRNRWLGEMGLPGDAQATGAENGNRGMKARIRNGM